MTTWPTARQGRSVSDLVGERALGEELFLESLILPRLRLSHDLVLQATLLSMAWELALRGGCAWLGGVENVLKR